MYALQFAAYHATFGVWGLGFGAWSLGFGVYLTDREWLLNAKRKAVCSTAASQRACTVLALICTFSTGPQQQPRLSVGCVTRDSR